MGVILDRRLVSPVRQNYRMAVMGVFFVLYDPHPSRQPVVMNYPALEVAFSAYPSKGKFGGRAHDSAPTNCQSVKVANRQAGSRYPSRPAGPFGELSRPEAPLLKFVRGINVVARSPLGRGEVGVDSGPHGLNR